MEDIYMLTERLVKAIEENECYKEYCRLKKEVDKDIELKHKLNQFKKAKFALDYNRNSGKATDFDEERYVSALYSKLVVNDIAAKYLECEGKVLELVFRINEAIGSRIKMDLDFMG